MSEKVNEVQCSHTNVKIEDRLGYRFVQCTNCNYSWMVTRVFYGT